MDKLPEEFIHQIESLSNPELVGLCDALVTTEPSVSVRVNPVKGVHVPDGADIVPWCATGYYLKSRQPFTFDPALHQGLYYAQDASSMIVGTVASALAGGKPVCYLDACAAPGGKSTAAVSVLPNGSLVVANEYVPARAAVLAENLAKWGSDSCVVSKGDTSRFRRLPGFFDIVAADVPCSGEGMMRKDDAAVEQWSPSLVEECAARQREIVDNLWETLRPGGYLIYSTCTFNRTENEDMLAYIIERHGGESVDLHIEELGEGIVRGLGDDDPACARFMPHRLRGEGLFVGVVRKPEEGDTRVMRPTRKKAKTISSDIKSLVAQASAWLNNSADYDIRLSKDGKTVFACRKEHAAIVDSLSEVLDIVSAGVIVGIVKGRALVPSQQLAISAALRADAFPCCEVEYCDAVAYLRRESLSLPTGVPAGFVLLTYRGYPHGFVKNIGNRATNLYPQAWRILSTHTPEEVPVVL